MSTQTAGSETILGARFTPEMVRAHLLPRDQWHPYPQAADRDGWAALPAETRSAIVARAEQHLGMAWPPLPATLFLEYVRDGNRTRYQAPYHARRVTLAQLVLGECIEGQGRFLDDIINGVWALCEESFWGVPAHSYSPRFAGVVADGRYRSAGLPDTAYPVVDLFAAETGALLAWTHYLLGEQFAASLPVVTERIEREIEAKILEPYRTIDAWNWLGKEPRRKPNNWNPWIHTNVLTMNLLIEPDETKRQQTVSRIIEGLDLFLAGYDADGGCDEGTSYWNRAGASLYECLDLLASASGGALDAFDLPLVREIGRYIYRMHLGGPWFVNFADGPGQPSVDGDTVYRYGRRIGDERMQALGAWANGRQHGSERPSIGRLLRALFGSEGQAPAGGAPPLVRDAWFPGIEVLVARERAGSTDGLFLAAKGGHNGESHNHNDVGQFIVALDGQPVIIDVGVLTYTRYTFGPNRYDIWAMQSGYHNLPQIDGHDQAAGEAYAARDVAANVGDDRAELRLDFAGAYPPEAGVRAWRRTVRLERDAGRVVLEDDYTLSHTPQRLTLTLMASGDVDTSQPGLLRCAGPTRPLLVEYDAAQFTPTVEPITITDERLLPVWGERINRVLLTARQPTAEGRWTLTMHA
ncbi:MAG: heparinase II/III domain-containing protein [Thermomicrobiales bacterium]